MARRSCSAVPRRTNSSKSAYAATARHSGLPSRVEPHWPSCGRPEAGPQRWFQVSIIEYHDTIRDHGLRTKPNDQ